MRSLEEHVSDIVLQVGTVSCFPVSKQAKALQYSAQALWA